MGNIAGNVNNLDGIFLGIFLLTFVVIGALIKGSAKFAVAGWYAKIGEPTLADAICDRIVHNSYTIKIEGNSMRKRKSISE